MKKVKGPVIAAIVIILIVIVVMVVLSLKKTQANSIGDDIKPKEERGIHFGGTFDEFQYFEEETESETILSREEILSEVDKKREEFFENAPGDIIKEEDNESNMNRIKKKDTVEKPDSETMENENKEPGHASVIKFEEYSENIVLYKTESMEEAQAVAEQIEGTVLSCENGMATIQINEHVDILLERLESQGSELILFKKYLN